MISLFVESCGTPATMRLVAVVLGGGPASNRWG